MADLSNSFLTLPLGGIDHSFARIQIDDLSELAAWANAQLIKAAFAAQPDLLPFEKAIMIKEIGRTYSISDINTLLDDGDCLLHLLGTAYIKANPGRTQADFLSLFNLTNISELQAWVDIVAGFGADADADTDTSAIGEGDSAPKPTAARKVSAGKH